MAERIYCPSSGSAPVAPSTWNHANQAGTTYTLPGIRSHLRSKTALTSRTTATGTTNPFTRAVFRYVFGPLAAIQITGTINQCMRCSESNAAANATTSIAVKLIQPGGADRSVLLAATASDLGGGAQEYTVTLGTRRASDVNEARPISLTSQTPTAGDYLVVEIGFRSATGTTYNVVQVHGDPDFTVDCPDSDGNTSAFIPWIEFSNKIPWQETALPDVNMAIAIN